MMGSNGNPPVLLTIRGKRAVADLEAARKLHNETAGSDQGIAACRALGDLSHKVYVAADGAEKFSDARKGELLFLDFWRDAEGLQTFFSNKMVQEQGSRLFSQKEPGVHVAAPGAFTFHLPAPMNRPNRFVGMLTGKVMSAEAAVAVFRESLSAALGEQRKGGQLSHQLFLKLAPPTSDGSVEICATDLWADLDGMLAAYGGEAMKGIGKIFLGKPSGSIWQQAPGVWNEW